MVYNMGGNGDKTNKVASEDGEGDFSVLNASIAQLNKNMEQSRIRSVCRQGRHAVAIGLAIASLRYDDRAGELSIFTGASVWRNEKAFAFGAGYTNISGKFRANLATRTTDNKWGGGFGLGYTFN